MALSHAYASLALGLDAGGTATRWALAEPGGAVVARGEAPGFSGVQLSDEAGRAAIADVLAGIAAEAGARGRIAALCLGATGFDGDAVAPLSALLRQAFGVPASAQRLYSDIELVCRALFAPGEGIVVYAGTGSVAAFVGADGVMDRAGGRGGLIDDGGSGYWIAREALRAIWRREDEEPGAWRGSPLARRVFEALGGSDWSDTREFVYGGSRGRIGLLARAVAAAADDDAEARDILQRAGEELARLARALHRRHGPLPVALAGRAFALHPLLAQAMRQALEDGRIVGPRRPLAWPASWTARSGAEEPVTRAPVVAGHPGDWERSGIAVRGPVEVDAHVAAARLAAAGLATAATTPWEPEA